MGNWNITIQGIGTHGDPNNPYAADVLAKKFVAELRKSHKIESAMFMSGHKNDLLLGDMPTDRTPDAFFKKDDLVLHKTSGCPSIFTLARVVYDQIGSSHVHIMTIAHLLGAGLPLHRVEIINTEHEVEYVPIVECTFLVSNSSGE